MLKKPAGIKGFGILIQTIGFGTLTGPRAETPGPIEFFDPGNGRQFLTALPGIIEKVKVPSPHNRSGCHPFCRFQVALDIRSLRELYLALVGEPFTTHRIHGKDIPKIHTQSRQVFDGIVIFSSGKSTHRHSAWCALFVLRSLFHFLLNERNDLTPLSFDRLCGLGWRHLLFPQHFQNS